jgi:Domain of unknown function (DUF5753)
VSAIGLDRVRIGIIPLGVELPGPPVGAFQIYEGEEAVVTVETLFEEITYRGEQAAAYVRLTDALWSRAVTGGEARAVLHQALEALPRT